MCLLAGPPDRLSDSRYGRGLNDQESLNQRCLANGLRHPADRSRNPMPGVVIPNLRHHIHPNQPGAPRARFRHKGRLKVAAGTGQKQGRGRTHGPPQHPRVIGHALVSHPLCVEDSSSCCGPRLPRRTFRKLSLSDSLCTPNKSSLGLHNRQFSYRFVRYTIANHHPISKIIYWKCLGFRRGGLFLGPGDPRALPNHPPLQFQNGHFRPKRGRQEAGQACQVIQRLGFPQGAEDLSLYRC